MIICEICKKPLLECRCVVPPYTIEDLKKQMREKVRYDSYQRRLV